MENKELNCEDGVCDLSAVEAPTSVPFSKGGDRLIYIGDPMCSWCWGITNHLDKLKDEFEDRLDFELILGGLRPGGGDEWTEEFRNMLRTHWEHVETASGQPFDFRFFDRAEFDYDTEPSARAVRVVRDLDASKEWQFYKRLQKAFYAENKDVHDLATYEALCGGLGLNYTAFEALFLSPGYKQLVNQDFAKSQQMGVRGFPAVVLKKGEAYHAVSLGYSDYDRMKATLSSILG
ncbi:DsbA family protein [Reichenbachiella carrageenanivorans]|uniref:DsbA family protein n=1 Tax=Reichenbachiella carrageenanivorans TaxID=2979869 RepID=A0ABY6CYB9_9BACT|nr:DsbA family protein [Reichenbachiella carrageenanivorans]UXX78379.1 DsbA family protein [Reichenbachiella carrageenanivorans]